MPSSQFMKFAVVGGIAFVVDAALLLFSTEVVGLIPEAGRLLSFMGAVTTTWYLNRTFTFATRKPPTFKEFFRYVLAMSAGMAINYLVFVILIHVNQIANAYPVVALVPSTLAGMMINFMFSRRILGSRSSSQ